jgi:hypothetical protein
LVFGLVLPKTLKPQRYERLTEKWAGLWIKNRSGEGVTIFTPVPRVAYYAKGSYVFINFKKSGIDDVKMLMDRKKAVYLVVQEKDAPFPFSETRPMVEVKRFAGKRLETIIIYQKIE